MERGLRIALFFSVSGIGRWLPTAPGSFANCTREFERELRRKRVHPLFRWVVRGRRSIIDDEIDGVWRHCFRWNNNEKDTHARYVVVVANTLLQKSIANLPSENRWTLPFIVGDFVHHRRGRHTWLATANCTWFNWTGLVVPGKINQFLRWRREWNANWNKLYVQRYNKYFLSYLNRNWYRKNMEKSNNGID